MGESTKLTWNMKLETSFRGKELSAGILCLQPEKNVLSNKYYENIVKLQSRSIPGPFFVVLTISNTRVIQSRQDDSKDDIQYKA